MSSSARMFSPSARILLEATVNNARETWTWTWTTVSFQVLQSTLHYWFLQLKVFLDWTNVGERLTECGKVLAWLYKDFAKVCQTFTLNDDFCNYPRRRTACLKADPILKPYDCRMTDAIPWARADTFTDAHIDEHTLFYANVQPHLSWTG